MNTKHLWNQVLQTMRQNNAVEEKFYTECFEPAEMYEGPDDLLYLVADSSFSKGVINDYTTRIMDMLGKLLPKPFRLNLLTKDEYKKIEAPLTSIESNAERKDFSFDAFVVGSSNKKAYMAAKGVSEALGQRWNPLFIYGNSALGKTHLLKAIQEDEKSHPGKKVLYITSSEFGEKAVEVLKDGFDAVEDFKKDIEKYDALLLDDIQFLAKREKTNEVFFSLFNYFFEHNKQIVLTSDKTPEQLNGFDNRMITRFGSGLTVSVDAPDVITARNILKNYWDKIIGDKYKLTKEAETYLATYYAPNVRKIENVINNISFGIEFADVKSDTIDIDILHDLLVDFPVSSTGTLNVAKIKEAVGDKYGVTISQIDGKMRIQRVATARHVAMYLVKDILDLSYTQIGAQFGGKDHTTVMNAVSKISSLADTDKELKKTLQKIKSEVTSK